MRRFTGTSVVPGLGVGRAVVLVRRGQTLRAPIAEGRVEDELGRLERARAESRQQLVAIRESLAKGRGADLAAIFDAQILMLDDPLLTGRAALLIREERANAEWAVQRALDELSRLFENLDDPYLRERGGDVADLIGRLRMNLRGGSRGWQDVLAQGEGPFVIVADDPSPSVAAQVDWSLVRGLAIDGGSRTSHTAILARSLGIPTVVGLGDASMQVTPGEMVALDGEDGVLVIGPDELELAAMARRQATRTSEQYPARPAGPGTSATRDGVRVRLEANVDRFEDVASALNAGADGVGLFRSESLLLNGTVQGLAGPASEAQQAEAYGRVIAAFAPAPVTIRTFDIDLAQAAALTSGVPSHPALERHRPLGLRGIRLGLAQPAILDTQFRAILRVASRGQVRILLPFVTSASEVRAARVKLDAAREALRAEGVSTPDVPLGAMIEVPAAALTADLLAARHERSRAVPARGRSDRRARRGHRGAVSPGAAARAQMAPEARRPSPRPAVGLWGAGVGSGGAVAARRLRRPGIQHDAGSAARRMARARELRQPRARDRGARGRGEGHARAGRGVPGRRINRAPVGNGLAGLKPGPTC
jgi:phosphotransferase system enzyme I (PtsI)